MKRIAALLAISVAGVVLPATARATPTPVRFGAPVKVNADGTWGYEPSIDVDSRGTLYVTAHKGSVLNEGTRLSSFLWSSRDAGKTWQEMASPTHAAESLYSFEGDISLDADGRLYFVDTFGADTWLSRWDNGVWERSAPAVTGSVFDDRPWIATQGEGVVWLLTTDVATHAVSNGLPEPADGSGYAYSQVLYRSTDGGVTWTLGTAFPDAQFCGLAASQTDQVSVAVACVVRAPGGQRLAVYRTGDAGLTWAEKTVYAYRGRADSFISIAYDKGGALVTAFSDALPTGHRLHVATGSSRGWSVRDVTPFRGAFSHVWTAADAKGKVGLAFYGTASPTPTAASDWFVYAGTTTPKKPWSFTRADAVPVMRGPMAPADFLQCVIAPNGRLYVAYSRSVETDVLHAPPPDFDHDIYVVSER